MKYKLIKPINYAYSATEQILTNRGIPEREVYHYLHTTDDDINSFLLLGEAKLREAATALVTCIEEESDAALIVDADCDGYTSAAILINYLYDLAPTWVENHLVWHHHKGKQHGLDDLLKWILMGTYSLVIVPDGGSNDLEAHKTLKDAEITTIVLDHHEINRFSTDAIVINVQTTSYPNKQLSGAGLAWQFCRYIDSLLDKDFADRYLDLVALGLTGDMMSLSSIETKHLIHKGFEPENIHNPFIYYMWQKNRFKLGEHITSWGAAFYIVPFVNAVVRSGTQEEKQIVFMSMINYLAFEEINSTKRGHKLGEKERRIDQALRICTNVKSRQTKTQDKTVETLENKIKDESLLNNKALVLLVNEDEDIDKNVAGLIANKLANKYQKPCCILTETTDDEGNTVYQGSARGCAITGVNNFKQLCEETKDIEYAAGHQGAFGLAVPQSKTQDFTTSLNSLLKDTPDEPMYYVDYIYADNEVSYQNILDIGHMGDLWGKDIDESLIAVEGLKITKDMITLMSPDKNPTIKIKLPNGIDIIKFQSSEEEYNNLRAEGYVKINLVGKCQIHEWNGSISPQILVQDYEVLDRLKYFF